MWSSTSSRPIDDDGIRCTDPVALNQWYPLSTPTELRLDLTYQTMLLGEPLRYGLTGDSQGIVWPAREREVAAGSRLPSPPPTVLPTRHRYGYRNTPPLP